MSASAGCDSPYPAVMAAVRDCVCDGLLSRTGRVVGATIGFLCALLGVIV